jgi:hypothetical protein
MDSARISVIADFLLDPSVARPGIQMPGYWGSQAAGHVRAMRSTMFTTPQAQTYAVARYIYYMTRMNQED